MKDRGIGGCYGYRWFIILESVIGMRGWLIVNEH